MRLKIAGALSRRIVSNITVRRTEEKLLKRIGPVVSCFMIVAGVACLAAPTSAQDAADDLISVGLSASASDPQSGSSLPEKPKPPSSSPNSNAADSSAPPADGGHAEDAQQQGSAAPPPQPRRILGLMPNFRAVSAGVRPPPPSPKQALWIATQNSFDYSSFVFVGITSLFAELSEAHPQLGDGGLATYGRYYWRGFVDKADGNYLVIFVFPTILRQDERYYAMGKGGIWKRLAYSSTRILITPNYQGKNGVNFSELLGRGVSQGISASYYPSGARTASALATKYGYALLRDAATNMFREFWPDINEHVLHRHH